MLKTFRSALDACEIEKLMVFTNDGFVMSMARSLGIDAAIMIQDIEPQESELLPAGTSSSPELFGRGPEHRFR